MMGCGDKMCKFSEKCFHFQSHGTIKGQKMKITKLVSISDIMKDFSIIILCVLKLLEAIYGAVTKILKKAKIRWTIQIKKQNRLTSIL